MTVAVITLVVALIGTLSLVAWLVHGDIEDAHKIGDTRVAQTETEAHLERAQYELEVEKKARIAAEHRAAALEEELSHEWSAPFPDAPALDPADTRGRLLRIAQRWGAADAARTSAVPAEPDKAVSVDRPAASSDPDGLLDPFVSKPVP